MQHYIVTYDLMTRGQDYLDLHEALESYPHCIPLTESTWIVSSSGSPRDVLDDLAQHINNDDRMAVGMLAGPLETIGFEVDIPT
jgi:hypothetical protein